MGTRRGGCEFLSGNNLPYQRVNSFNEQASGELVPEKQGVPRLRKGLWAVVVKEQLGCDVNGGESCQRVVGRGSA